MSAASLTLSDVLQVQRAWSTKGTPGTMSVSPAAAVNDQSDHRVSSPKELTLTAAPAMTRSLPNTVSAAKRCEMKLIEAFIYLPN